MPVKVKARAEDISVFDMKDGDIGVITCFEGQPSATGTVVQRYMGALIAIGKDSEHSWDYLLKSDLNSGDTRNSYRVRLLQKGDLIEVV